MGSLSTETDLDGADVRLEATADAGVNTAGATPGALASPGQAHELVTLVAKELLHVLLDLVNLANSADHICMNVFGKGEMSRRTMR